MLALLAVAPSAAAAPAPRLVPARDVTFASLNTSVLRARAMPFDPRGPGADSTFVATSSCCGYGPFSAAAVAAASARFGLFDVPCIEAWSGALPLVAEWGYEFLNNQNGIFPLCGNLTEAGYAAPPADRDAAYARLELYWRCRAAAERARAGQPPASPIVSEIGHYLFASMSALMDDGGSVIPGSEIGENINSIQAHFAHIRGAARQFGSPFLVDFSAWFDGTITDFSPPPGFWGAGTSSPVGGHSLSLFKRAYCAAFMAGAGALVAEAGAVNFFFENKTADGVFNLSPLGEIGRGLYAFAHGFGAPAAAARGIPYVPVAVVTELSFGAGLGWFYQGMSWDAFPLSDAELATQALLDALWPGSFKVESQIGTPESESGYMVAGGALGADAADLLLPRNLSAATLLGGYSVAIVAGLGEGGLDEALAAALVAFVEGGGSVVLAAADAAAAIEAGWLPPSFLGFAALAPPAPGELFNASLVRDLQTGWTRPTASAEPFCVEAAAGQFYIKTGGDPAKRSGWDGGGADRCCSTDAADCRWFASATSCAEALPLAPIICRACPAAAASSAAAAAAAGSSAATDVGCPAWSAPGAGLPVGLYGVVNATTAQPVFELQSPGGATAACAVLSMPGGGGAGGGSGSVLTLLTASSSIALAPGGLGLAPHLLGRLQDDLLPVALADAASGNASAALQLLVNRVPSGWLVTLVNNDGVTKQPAAAAIVDASKAHSVTITLQPGWGAVRSAWLSAGGALPVEPLTVDSGRAVALTVAAGDVAVVFLELEQPGI